MSDTRIRVWDPFIRVFHWSLVAGFAVAYLSGEDEGLLHPWSGYVVGILILARLIWGFVGSRHARFRDFIYTPGQVKDYLKNLFAGRPVHYLGHNPAGGWMIFALLICLVLTTVSGLQAYGVEGHGPLAASQPDAAAASAQARTGFIRTAYANDEEEAGHAEGKEEELWEEVHEFLANLTLLLVLVHIAGVVVASRMHRENLVRAMLTGYKQEH